MTIAKLYASLAATGVLSAIAWHLGGPTAIAAAILAADLVAGYWITAQMIIKWARDGNTT